MTNGLEFAQRRAADTLAGRIGAGEFGKFFFEFEQLVIKPVVIVVGNRRFSLDVISMIVSANFFDELLVAFFGLGLRHAGIFNAKAQRSKAAKMGKSLHLRALKAIAL